MLWCILLTCEHLRFPSPIEFRFMIAFTILYLNANLYSFRRVKTRLQVQVKRKETDPAPTGVEPIHYTSTWHAITKIVDDDGVLGLYNGIHGALIGVASTNFAYFYWYSVVRTVYIAQMKVKTPPSTAIELALGAAAGAVAQIFTIPVAVVTTRQQTQSKGERKGMVDTAKEVIHSEDGWTGLWRGLKASLVLVVNPAITYGAYQRLREVIFPGKLNLRPWEAFCKLSFSYGNVELLLTLQSTRSHVKIPRDNRDPTINRCKSWSSIKTTSIPRRETIQEFPRGNAIYHSKRRIIWTIQGNWTSNHKRSSSTRTSHDDKRKVSFSHCNTSTITYIFKNTN